MFFALRLVVPLIVSAISGATIEKQVGLRQDPLVIIYFKAADKL